MKISVPSSQTTREKILDVAKDLFVENGYLGTPLSLISAKLGFTKAALYYHFKSKADILAAILAPLLDGVDELLVGTPQTFANSEQRWDFMLAYADLMLSEARAITVLSIGGTHAWMPDEILERIEIHRARTTELAMLPDVSEEGRVKAILLMDVMHREIVFERGRPVIDGMSAERRREIVYDFVRRSLDEL